MSHGADYCHICCKDLFLSSKVGGCDCKDKKHCSYCGREVEYCEFLPCANPQYKERTVINVKGGKKKPMKKKSYGKKK